MNLKQKLNETSKKSIELKEERRKRRIDEVKDRWSNSKFTFGIFQQALKNNSEYYLAFCTPWYDDLFDNEISIKTELYNKTIILTEKINYSDNEYGTLLHAAINYEKDKFISTEEIEVAWKISDDILSYKEESEIY